MPGLGTIVNVVAVILGGTIGVFFGNNIKESIREQLMRVLGLSVIFVGIAGTLSKVLTIDSNGSITTYGTTMMIISLALGTLLGELIKIEQHLERFGEWLKRKVKAQNDNGFTSAFVSSSLVVCVGAMAIMGSIQDGLTADHTTLFAKSLLDCLIIMIMASTMGIGCIFSFIPIGILQGSVTALAKVCAPILSTGNIIGDISLVGSVLICCVGINLAFGKRFNVGNMLMSLLVTIAYSLISFYVTH